MDYKISNLHVIIGLIFSFISGSSSKCGPLGFEAESLVKLPGVWYFDLPKASCPPPLKPDVMTNNGTSNGTSTYCRIFMSLCEPMKYPCCGTVCSEFITPGSHLDIMLGERTAPFNEGDNQFAISFDGEKLPCGEDGVLTPSKTAITFQCDKNSNWTRKSSHWHQEYESPTPVSAQFDSKNCQFDVKFNYSGACFTLPPGETLAQNISVGSIALILFFPGILLYFIIGILVNRMRGRTGKEAIPHHQFWFDLPELIMDGFVFTMSFLTCRQEDTKMNYDTM